MKFKTRTNKDALDIRAIPVDNDKRLEGVAHPLPSNCHCLAFVGAPGSGKTNLVQNYLTSPKAYKGKFDIVHFFTGSAGTLPEAFLKKLRPERIHHGLEPEELQAAVDECAASDGKCLIVLDDVCTKVTGDNQKILQNFVYNRRHVGGGCSLWLITQKYNAIPLSIRTAIDNIIMFNLSSRRELESVWENVSALGKDEFIQLVQHVVKNRKGSHDFLFIQNGCKFHHNHDTIEVEDE